MTPPGRSLPPSRPRAARAPAVAGPVIRPTRRLGTRLQEQTRDRDQRNGVAIGGLKRLPIQINEGSAGWNFSGEARRRQERPVSQLTLDMIGADRDVVLHILKAKQAARIRVPAQTRRAIRTRGVVDLKKAYDARSRSSRPRERLTPGARRVGEANKTRHEMETLIGHFSAAGAVRHRQALLAKAEKHARPASSRARPGARRKDYIYNPEISVTDTTDGIYRRLVSSTTSRRWS